LSFQIGDDTATSYSAALTCNNLSMSINQNFYVVRNSYCDLVNYQVVSSVAWRLLFRLPCSLVDHELGSGISTCKGSWGELYNQVIRAYMNRAPSGTFHSHNFNTVMAGLLRDTSERLVWLTHQLVFFTFVIYA